MHANIQQALWMTHPVLELSLAGVLFWRRLHRTFPVFFAYVVFQFVNFALLFPIYRYHNGRPYFYAYWISAAISLAIGFKVIHEIFLDVLRPYPNLNDLGTLLFKWAGLVMLLVAIVVTAASQPGSDTVLGQAVIIGQRCMRFIQCGLILFLLFFSRHLGVSRRQYSFGIALGFGSFAAVELVVFALISGGQIRTASVSIVNTAAYSLVDCHLDRIRVAEDVVPGRVCQTADVAALGSGTQRVAAPGGWRFLDSHVREHGGPGVLACAEGC